MKITKEWLEKSDYGRSLISFIKRHVAYVVMDWGNNDSDDKDANRPEDRRQTGSLSEANITTSLRPNGRHDIVLDIDHPAWLIPSTTPKHYHLYIEMPEGLDESSYFALLDLLGRFKIIERGYASASKERGFTCVRMPWVAKESA